MNDDLDFLKIGETEMETEIRETEMSQAEMSCLKFIVVDQF